MGTGPDTYIGAMSTTTAARRADTTGDTTRRILTKVPEITVVFSLLKLLSTGMGEVMSDYAGQRLDDIRRDRHQQAVLSLAMWLQLRQRSYRAPCDWFAVAAIAVFGTMTADGIHADVGVSYAITTLAFALITAAIFAIWYRSEDTLSIHSIDTRRRELFYWAAVLGTFALWDRCRRLHRDQPGTSAS